MCQLIDLSPIFFVVAPIAYIPTNLFPLRGQKIIPLVHLAKFIRIQELNAKKYTLNQTEKRVTIWLDD